MVVFPSHWKKVVNIFFPFSFFKERIRRPPLTIKFDPFWSQAQKWGWFPSFHSKFQAAPPKWKRVVPRRSYTCVFGFLCRLWGSFPILCGLWFEGGSWCFCFCILSCCCLILKEGREEGKKEIKVSSLFRDKHPHFQIRPCQIKMFPWPYNSTPIAYLWCFARSLWLFNAHSKCTQLWWFSVIWGTQAFPVMYI